MMFVVILRNYFKKKTENLVVVEKYWHAFFFATLAKGHLRETKSFFSSP